MKYFYVPFLFAAFFSCVNRNLKDYQPATVQSTEDIPLEPVSYLKDIKPIIENRCNKCHKGADDMDWSVYENLHQVTTTKYAASDEDSKLISRLKNTKYGARMPQDGPPFLTNEQISLIERWAKAGAPNN